MAQFYNLLESVLILCLLILCTFWLKKCGIVSHEYSSTFSRLVTDLVLPALIFVSLAGGTFSFKEMIPAAIMLVSILVCCCLGWFDWAATWTQPETTRRIYTRNIRGKSNHNTCSVLVFHNDTLTNLIRTLFIKIIRQPRKII